MEPSSIEIISSSWEISFDHTSIVAFDDSSPALPPPAPSEAPSSQASYEYKTSGNEVTEITVQDNEAQLVTAATTAGEHSRSWISLEKFGKVENSTGRGKFMEETGKTGWSTSLEDSEISSLRTALLFNNQRNLSSYFKSSSISGEASAKKLEELAASSHREERSLSMHIIFFHSQLQIFPNLTTQNLSRGRSNFISSKPW
ncbi:hypothetical protein ANCCAN_29676 [Ancylostoma caninum]|uniref:Uncharacterized protein n=1 Tax=Ancylostoma caninum TaxID=29170 RepID=A0A368EXY6_ANCCA|nr:hypothetical protein ANCCAN_29676 [Ancylostoma caninum]